MSEVLTFGSLFSGIGGIDLGFERAGMRCAWQVEIDEWCRKVLAKHWPDVERFEDVREVGKRNLAPVDVICGGFPCQDISYAGKGAGIEGERSGLWGEFARIIRELRPRYVVVENVPALLRRGMGRVLGDLAACGYDAEWDCVPASAVGAPHRRDRVFVVAYAECGGCGARAGLCESEPAGQRRRRSGDARRAVFSDAGCELLEGREAQGADHRYDVRGFGDWWATEPRVGRVAHGVPARVDRLRGLGNAVVPQVAEHIGRIVMEHAGVMEHASVMEMAKA